MKQIILILLLLVLQANMIVVQIPKYCGRWDNCGGLQNLQCVNHQCVQRMCSVTTDCAQQFTCLNGICQPNFRAGDFGEYCDKWTNCLPNQACGYHVRKCIPKTCTSHNRCSSGFSCVSNICTPNSYVGVSTGYCDQYTRCSNNEQCINKMCLPWDCRVTYDCAVGFFCRNGKCAF